MSYFDYLIFLFYPYVVLSIFVSVSIFRFFYRPYNWKTASSEIFEDKILKLGSNLFHFGILALFLGHLFGLLTPERVFQFVGLSSGVHQMIEIAFGSVFGAITIIGVLLLIFRRLTNKLVLATSTSMDIFVLLWIFFTLCVGMMCVIYSFLFERDGHLLLYLSQYVKNLLTFRFQAINYLNMIPVIYRVHMFLGFTLFLILPFSRLVHIFSGFALPIYLVRKTQIIVKKF
ncbi:respiratory nitrate reductase, gamma subunit [Thermodesulfobium narugense DSM 14796]|uniref:nitrate reductase (quinone) n=1 Tax=Thermodesulfobium narugense DSM 14796 TaxID=747365 RepID=M1E5J2_9BACT|nr:respiratory nitrate reductase subunit gamma [Thermodesulfobium narugense]AEE13748.1 respiratory nitrate reductase, gamma subunit [Thermodesulfobium narugense DSM 14796]